MNSSFSQTFHGESWLPHVHLSMKIRVSPASAHSTMHRPAFRMPSSRSFTIAGSCVGTWRSSRPQWHHIEIGRPGNWLESRMNGYSYCVRNVTSQRLMTRRMAGRIIDLHPSYGGSQYRLKDVRRGRPFLVRGERNGREDERNDDVERIPRMVPRPPRLRALGVRARRGRVAVLERPEGQRPPPEANGVARACSGVPA